MAIKKVVWSIDGWVSSVVTTSFNGMELWLHGIGSSKDGRMFDWSATVTPSGWKVITEGHRGPEQFQGTTFNLALEVISAINRSI